MGRVPETAAEYEHALALCDNDAECRFLRRRLAETDS
jgi:predicted RNA polymerase sigma factor